MASAARDIAKCFVRNDVQSILKSLTGFNLNKIYKATFNQELLNSRMELLSNEQLEKVRFSERLFLQFFKLNLILKEFYIYTN